MSTEKTKDGVAVLKWPWDETSLRVQLSEDGLRQVLGQDMAAEAAR